MGRLALSRRILWGVGALCLAATGLPWLAGRRIGAASQGRIYSAPDPCPARPAAIVPGAKVWGDDPSPILEDRLFAGLSLYRLGKVRTILVTGAPGEPTAMEAWLRRQGVPAEAIRTDSGGLRTRDSMERAVRLHGIREAIVATQRFHLGRSLYLARHAGIDAVGVEADRRPYRNARFYALREMGARVLAFLETEVIRRGGAGGK